MAIKPVLKPAAFAKRVLAWFEHHGRQHLPWQQTPVSVYRVWVSEIMLQQTQVTTVIPYFQRFMQHFPSVAALAAAPLDEVLHLWTGLGYYARARNLHRCAHKLVADFDGTFPQDLDTLQTLPGIGRSTAGAILALTFNQPTAILDGNVKRVLTRYHAIEGWPSHSEVNKQLWALAERYTPKQRVAEYTQAMMDLGAMLCTRSTPSCGACPLADRCQAKQLQRVAEFPTPKPRRDKPVKRTVMAMIQQPTGRVLLTQRPPHGIWGGLWSFPEVARVNDAKRWCQQQLGGDIIQQQRWQTFRHSFTHYHLDITPVRLTIEAVPDLTLDSAPWVWYNLNDPDKRGLAAPVKRLLTQLGELSQ